MASLFSNSWYRVAELKPRLRAHAQMHRHTFRGQIWYVLQDHQTGRFFRVSPAANRMLCLMDGRRSLREIWDIAGERASEDPPTQDETIQLLAQLHAADLLQGELPPDIGEIAERSQQSDRRRLIQRLRNPMALRLPLFDPDRLLDWTLPAVRPLFSIAGFACWLTLVAVGAVLAMLNWSELVSNVADRVLVAQNIALIALVYPIMKALHEAGHAYATKVWGGEVHEVGVMLLVFIPVPYVDASASAAFRHKRRRIVVGAAGIIVELALAAIALVVWVNASPGLGRAVAFDVVLIGGVSTLFFNGNPLLRFDGYYILADLIEIPNLATRANAYLFFLVQRHLLGIDGLDDPASAPGEAKWLLGYAILSFFYRVIVSFGIAVFLATRLFLLGAAMAIWAIISIAVLPILKGIRFLITSSRLRGQRRRALTVVGGLAAAALAVLFLIPLPYATVAQGVVWIPERAEVRAKAEGFVTDILSTPGSRVAAHRELVTLADPILSAKVALIDAQREEMQLRLDAVRQLDRVQAEVLQEQVQRLTSTLAAYRTREDDLNIAAEQDGRFILPHAEDLPGRFFKRGDLVGYVVGDNDLVVRVVVPQADVDLVRQRTRSVEAYFAENLDEPVSAHIQREVPAAQTEVPSLALTTQAGGPIVLDPAKTQKPQSLFSMFLFDVDLLKPVPPRLAGARVYVRFDHGYEPLAFRIMRAFRQFFLGQFHV
ncbi:MAG TPA: peptidase M50 [Xanthobacteraceae bacterium]|nr:peptidase M50 [Xanthobacteraceae bacterium]